ncbi:MAG: hypothetical protein LRZ88_11725 [Candidatus Cloacimonetes bacterium]|nr:hypothetical protein [Candidatus Cloacimonadota bacterium]
MPSSPKMLQSLKMLALPILELESYIKQELETNPLLELREDKDEEDINDTSYAQEAPESNTPIEDIDSPESDRETIAEARQLTEILDQWNDYHAGGGDYNRVDTEGDHGEALIRYEGNSKDTYLEQLYPLNLPEPEVDFITELVDSCDVYGFLRPVTISKPWPDALGSSPREQTNCMRLCCISHLRESPLAASPNADGATQRGAKGKQHRLRHGLRPI